jgi:hypothetical protein
VQQVVDEVFGNGWSRINGPGHINVKPKFRAGAPTISINVVPATSGGSDVTMWLSAWKTRYGAVGHAQMVWRKERALRTSLSDAVSQTTSGTLGATTVAGAAQTSSDKSAPRANHSSSDASVLSDKSNSGSGPITQSADYVANGNNPLSNVCKVVADSNYSIIVWTDKSPNEIAAAVERSLIGVQPGSMDHLLIGPPRATMWVYILESPSDNNILAISLVTRDNPDRNFVEESIVAPVRGSLLQAIDGELEIRDSRSPLGPLEGQILRSRLVPVSEYKSEKM